MRSATSPTLPLGLILGTTALAALILAASQARANILNVSANVAADCSVQAGSLSFGAYDPVSDKDVTGSFTITCSIDADVVIGLDHGANWTGLRNVKNGDATIPYQLFQNEARTVEWGDEAVVSSGKRLVEIQGGGTAREVDVYGRLLTQGSKSAGAYSDVVNITFSVQ